MGGSRNSDSRISDWIIILIIAAVVVWLLILARPALLGWLRDHIW